MKKVIVSPYVEDGVLKVNVIRIEHGSLDCEELDAEGAWITSSIYRQNPKGGFSVSKATTEEIAKGLSK